ncbi:lipocalin/fatty-acid binding family protein [Sorangium sp. So ce375]|uniref:lipocalin/fatty-acid binding family protein n=1 Tax=Sorangium sp. So ce375 TaxID=3133306 RepID=UPI003F5C72F6
MSASSSKTTIDHDEIRQWVESRGGRPATVKSTEEGGEPGILRIDFPGYSGEDTLEEISWEDFFGKFEETNLAFVYQEKTADGQPSRFSKLVSRPDDMVQKGKSTARVSKGSAAKASSARGTREENGKAELDVEVEVQLDLDEEPGGAEKHARGKHARSKGAEGEHASHVTIDHDEIRTWVEARGGHPATVERTEKEGEPGVLRIDFPGYSGEESLKEISWDDFFDKFEASNLAFVYQEAKASGEPSYFSKLVSRPEDIGGKKAKQSKQKSRKAA